jgi:hypothetical protein
MTRLIGWFVDVYIYIVLLLLPLLLLQLLPLAWQNCQQAVSARQAVSK